MHDPDVLVNMIRGQNKCIFSEDSEFECVGINKVKKKENKYYAVLQVDQELYKRIINNGYLFIGYNACPVYDAIDVMQCFKCCGFHHISNNCHNAIACPKCAGHQVKDCTAENLKCVNCLNQKDKSNLSLSNHAAWDKKCCPIYIRKLAEFKNDIIGPM